jgi:hypothetical protein
MTMTDRKDRLIKLLAKVEAGSKQWSANDIFEAIGRHKQKHFNAAFHGSIDAAKALHAAVLPGWINVDIIWSSTPLTSTWRVTMSDGRRVAKASNPDPARAWLIAILKALIAVEDTNANDKGE